MKLNLECGTNFIMGYRNIDTTPQHQGVEQGSFRSIPVEDNSLEEIKAINVIDKVKMKDVGAVMHHWVSKLLPKTGILYLESLDPQVMGNLMAYEQISIPDTNQKFFESNRKAIYNIASIENLLNQLEMTILEKGITGSNFHIKAVKNG